MREVSSNQIIAFELSIVLLALFALYIIKVSVELSVNLVFILLLCTLIMFRNRNIRHMYFAFFLLLASFLGNVFGFENFVYFSSILTLCMLILGALNMILFNSNSSDEK